MSRGWTPDRGLRVCQLERAQRAREFPVREEAGPTSELRCDLALHLAEYLEEPRVVARRSPAGVDPASSPSSGLGSVIASFPFLRGVPLGVAFGVRLRLPL